MKIFTGKVISTKMTNTATVAVERVVVHPVYKKRFKRVKKYHLHDEIGAKVGQTVKFVASKPYSKLKKWKLLEIIEKKVQEEKKGGKLKTKSKKTK
jgi:small subunit ribosomal protein S17